MTCTRREGCGICCDVFLDRMACARRGDVVFVVMVFRSDGLYSSWGLWYLL